MRLLFVKILALSLFWGTMAKPSIALEIPLTGGSGGDAQKIAYVDMDRIFEVFPQTKFAKEDYMERLTKKREVLNEKEKELQSLQERLLVLESALKESQAAPADPLFENPDANANAAQRPEPQAVSSLKRELEAKKMEIEEEKQRAREELEKFEGQQSEIILGKIYQALKTLAEERQVNLVVDKSSILFGSAEIDLTDALQEKVRGY